MNTDIFTVTKGEKPLDNIKETCGFAGIFKEIGVIGDSLSSGEFEAHDKDGNITYNDMYQYSWPAVLQRLTDTKYNNYSRGGMTAKEYLDSWADANGFWQKNQAYIIALGNNDIFVFNHGIGNATDIDLKDCRNNADTFFGNLGRIIVRLKQLQKDARIFIVAMERRGEPQKDAIIKAVALELQKVCEMFDFTYLIDMTTYGPVYDHKVRTKYGMGFHPNAMGYYAYALMIGNYIDYIIRSKPAEFSEVPFIGTDLKNNDIKYPKICDKCSI